MTTHSGRRGLVKDSVFRDSCDPNRHGDGGRNNFDNTAYKKRSKRKIGEKEIEEYIANKAYKRATKVAKKLKLPSVSVYSINSNPFGDSNLNEKFVWRKKIERDVSLGVALEEFSIKAEMKKLRERMAEIDRVKRRREERAIQKAQHQEEMAMLARARARSESEFSKTEQVTAGSYSPKLLQSGGEEEDARAIWRGNSRLQPHLLKITLRKMPSNSWEPWRKLMLCLYLARRMKLTLMMIPMSTNIIQGSLNILTEFSPTMSGIGTIELITTMITHPRKLCRDTSSIFSTRILLKDRNLQVTLSREMGRALKLA